MMSESGFKGDRWLTTAQAAEFLGCADESQVRVLIHDRKLPAKKRSIRGKGKRPHYFVLLSDAKKYMDGLEDGAPEPTERVKKSNRRSANGRLEDVIEFV